MTNYLYLLIFLISVTLNGVAQKKIPSDFLPEGYSLFETHYGDLNKDGEEDCILIIKKVDENNIVINRFDEKVDRNRRGVIVLFKKENTYQLADKNLECFSSENEDGGVYFPPELLVKVEKGNLIVHYGHGRYGYWKCIFRYQDSNFKLIGYDETNGGVVIRDEVSINFLTKKKLTKENINEDSEGGDEVFKENWEKIKVEKLLELSEIKDFFEIDFSIY